MPLQQLGTPTSIFTQDIRFTNLELTVEDGALKDLLTESIGYIIRVKNHTGEVSTSQGNPAIDHLLTAIGALHSDTSMRLIGLTPTIV